MLKKGGSRPPALNSGNLAGFILILLCPLAVMTPTALAVDFGTPVWTNRHQGTATGSQVDIARAVATDASGNVFVTGTSWIGSSSDCVTVAYSGDGVPLWTNIYNGPANKHDEAFAMVVDGGGNVIVAGSTDLDANVGGIADYFAIKYSEAGVASWTNRYNGAKNKDDYAWGVAVDGSGNVLVTGSAAGNVGGYDYVTIKYSSAGMPLWTNTYDGTANGYDSANAIAVDGSGNVFVTGESYGSGNTPDFATVAYSGAGEPLWTNRFTLSGNSYEQAYAVAVDGNGDVFVTGTKAGGEGTDGSVTIKYSGAGVPLWTNRGPAGSTGFANAVDRSGNVFVTGDVTSAYSSQGVPLWTNAAAGGFNLAWAMGVDLSGNVFVTGKWDGGGSIGDYATVAYSGAGVPLWTNRYNGPGNGDDTAYALAVDKIGNVIVAGFSSGGNSVADYATIKYSALESVPPTITQTALENGRFQLLFTADSNHAYVVEFRDFMDFGNWATLTNIAALPTSGSLVITSEITNDAQYFRVRSP